MRRVFGWRAHGTNRATQALALDGQQVKALFRRATAHAALGEWEEAVRDYKACLAVEPANASARQGLAALNAQIAEQNKKDRARYASLFG